MLHKGNLLKVKQETTEWLKQTNNHTKMQTTTQTISRVCKKSSEGHQGKQSFTQKLQKNVEPEILAQNYDILR